MDLVSNAENDQVEALLREEGLETDRMLKKQKEQEETKATSKTPNKEASDKK